MSPMARPYSMDQYLTDKATGRLVMLACVLVFGIWVMRAIAVVLLPVAIFFILHNWRRRSRLRPLLDSIKRRSCPDCKYPLAEVSVPASGGEAMAAFGGACGPARCPECGVSWPIVPPPLPKVTA